MEHPLLPFRVFPNRTRAASFVAMFLAPAAMFAMFYFLSLYIQKSWATARSRPASRSCRSRSASWSAAGLASNLVNRIDPRYLAGSAR